MDLENYIQRAIQELPDVETYHKDYFEVFIPVKPFPGDAIFTDKSIFPVENPQKFFTVTFEKTFVNDFPQWSFKEVS